MCFLQMLRSQCNYYTDELQSLDKVVQVTDTPLSQLQGEHCIQAQFKLESKTIERTNLVPHRSTANGEQSVTSKGHSPSGSAEADERT